LVESGIEVIVDNTLSRGVYIFQENTLVVPSGTSDSGLQAELPDQKAEELLGEAFESDRFEIPPADGSGIIRGLSVSGKAVLPAGWKAVPMRQVVNLMTREDVMADGVGPVGRLLRAFHIAQWRKESAFCGICGSPNEDAETGELARKCPVCGRLEFPRISPAVITIIINDRDEALLAHNKKFANRVYSLIAGFNEVGESLEATVVREIREEVSLEVKDIRYIRSQPWPFPNSLMLGFAARHAGGEIKPDGIEIEDARWFKKDDLPELPGYGSVARSLIGQWLEGKL
jgi:NAD+ diphosphatase